MKGSVKLLVVLGVLAVLFATNPGKKKHVDAIVEGIKSEGSTGKGLAELVGGIIGGAVIEAIVPYAVSYTNCYLFSLGYMGDDLTSVGLLGNAIYLPGLIPDSLKDND